MKHLLFLVIAALAALPFFGCGGSKQSARPALGSVPKGGPDAAAMRLRDWEWYVTSSNRFPVIHGIVLTPDGKPVPDATATFYLHPPKLVSAPKPIESVKTNAEGVFTGHSVPDDAWVFVTARGFAGRVIGAKTVFLSRKQPYEFSLRKCTTVIGTVTDGRRQPVAGVRLMASTRGPDWFATTVSDEHGKFRIEGVPREPVVFGTLPGKYMPLPKRLDLSKSVPTNLDLGVREAQPVTGEVVDKATGKPIAGAFIFALIDRERLIVSDAQGRFEIKGACKPWFMVRAFGYGEAPGAMRWADRRRAEFVRVELERGAIVKGKVVDEKGKPVEGVRVRAQLFGPKGPGHMVRGPVTGKDGTFEIGWIPLVKKFPECRVLAQGPDHAYAYSGAVELSRRAVGDAGTLTMPSLVRFRAVVDDDENKPIVGAPVFSHFVGKNPSDLVRLPPNDRTGLSDAGGAFELDDLLPGPQKILIAAHGRLPFTHVFTVKGGDQEIVHHITLPKGLEISGRIVFTGEKRPDKLSMLLLDPHSSLRQIVAVSKDLTFSISGLDPVDYILEATAENCRPARQKVHAGAEDVKLVLRALSQLTVSVTAPKGVKLAGRLELLGTGGEARQNNPLGRDLTKARHKFVFKNLVPGSYLVVVRAGDYWARKKILLVKGRNANEELPLQRGGTVEGTVRLPNGKEVSGVGVVCSLVGELGRQTADTDRTGTYRFAGVPPGDVEVRVHPNGYPASTGRITVKAGRVAQKDLVLATGGRVLIRAKDAQGRPLSGVAIGITTADGSPAEYWAVSQRTRTAANGKIEFVGLAPGRYTIVGHLGDRKVEKQKVEVRNAKRTDVDLVFKD